MATNKKPAWACDGHVSPDPEDVAFMAAYTASPGNRDLYEILELMASLRAKLVQFARTHGEECACYFCLKNDRHRKGTHNLAALNRVVEGAAWAVGSACRQIDNVLAVFPPPPAGSPEVADPPTAVREVNPSS